MRNTSGLRGGGKPGNKGGGRLPDEFKRKCAKLASSPKFFKWAEKVFNDEPVNPRLDTKGEVVWCPASVGDKIVLWEKLSDRGFGKPSQAIEVSGLDGFHGEWEKKYK